MYSDHQKAAAEIAAQNLPLTPQEVLTVAATMRDTPLNLPLGTKHPNYVKEHEMSVEELAKHLEEECLRVRGRWTDILRG